MRPNAPILCYIRADFLGTVRCLAKEFRIQWALRSWDPVQTNDHCASDGWASARWGNWTYRDTKRFDFLYVPKNYNSPSLHLL